MNRSFLCSILYFVDRGKAEADALILNGGFLMDYNNYDRGYAEPSMSASDYMTRTYRWMAGGLLVTFAMAYITATTPLIYLVDSLYFLLTIGELALVFMLSARVQKMSIDGARAAFFGYAILNGMVLSYYFLMFSVGTLVMAFLATAVYFGLMAVYGTTTHKDLTGWGPRLMMALVAMIVNQLVWRALRLWLRYLGALLRHRPGGVHAAYRPMIPEASARSTPTMQATQSWPRRLPSTAH